MINKTKLLQLLDNKKINYNIFDHPPLHSVKDSINMRGAIDGAHTKNLFLKNKRNNFFLFSCLESTIIDLKLLKKNPYILLDRIPNYKNNKIQIISTSQ